MKIKYSIGSNLDNNLIEGIFILSKKYNIEQKNVEIFFGFPGLNYSLDRYLYNNISILDFVTHIKYIKSKGFIPRFIFNVFNIDLTNHKLDYFLDLLKKLGVKHLTVADIGLIKYIHNKYGKFFIIGISTVNRIDTIKKFQKFDGFNYDKVILSHSLNYDLKNLKYLVSYFNSKNIGVELVANELTRCDSKCYKCHTYLSMQNTKIKINHDKIEDCCGLEKGINLVKKGNLIRPEDILIYENIGIYSLKLGLRKTETERSLKN